MEGTIKFNQLLISLISIMHNGDIHSGEVLGQMLGVSRAAVWKQLQQLKLIGLEVETIKGQGYRIPNGLDLLSADKILAALPNSVVHLVADVSVNYVLSSTNQYLMDSARGNQPIHGVVCLAEMQSAGRGRRGRAWQSPFARNIYMSVAWKFEQGIAAIEGLSLTVGLVVNRALRKIGATRVSLKWPNDLLVEYKKLGGILIEIAGDVSGECYVVIGLGINIAMPANCAENIDQPWTDLSKIMPQEEFNRINRSELVSAILQELLPVLAAYEVTGFAPFRKEWETMHAHQNAIVEVATPAQKTLGTVLGVTDSGALRLEVAGQEKIFVGGEVSLRRAS